MELLKYNPIIDSKYKPNIEMNYLDYFNRAMAFVQSNYQDQLDRVSKTTFFKLAPTIFFEEYVWSLLSQHQSVQLLSEYFKELMTCLSPLYFSFWDLNKKINIEDFESQARPLIKNESNVQNIIKTVQILNRGIKLFGWDAYKNNFLNTPEKLNILPGLTMAGANHLHRNIGINFNVSHSPSVALMAKHWGFEDSQQLCKEIQKNFPFQPKIIELILWYANITF